MPVLPTHPELLEPYTKIDEVRLFMFYVLFGGDCRRVAQASRVEQSRIEALARDFSWKSKIGNRPGLGTDAGAEDERALNRVANYVTATRLRRVFDRLVDDLDSDPAFARAFCTVFDDTTKETSYSVRNLVELAKGIQTVNDISYRALQDKQAQAADISSAAVDGPTLALATYKALVGRFDRNQIVNTSLELTKATSDAQVLPEVKDRIFGSREEAKEAAEREAAGVQLS